MARMREERKVITVLSADLVDSTPLGESLDTEDVRLIIGEAVSRMVQAVETYGGTVKDLAGDGILALFGPPDDPTLTAGTQPVRRRKNGVRTASQVIWSAPKFQARVGVL